MPAALATSSTLARRAPYWVKTRSAASRICVVTGPSSQALQRHREPVARERQRDQVEWPLVVLRHRPAVAAQQLMEDRPHLDAGEVHPDALVHTAAERVERHP